jgi:hypothetical protein
MAGATVAVAVAGATVAVAGATVVVEADTITRALLSTRGSTRQPG